MGFGLGHRAASTPDRVDLVYTLEANEWNGRAFLRLGVKDFRPTRAGQR